MPAKKLDRFQSASFSFGVEVAALRMRLWGQQPKQSKATTRRLANPLFNDSDTALRGSAFFKAKPICRS